MRKIRYGVIVLWMMLFPATFAGAQVSIDIGLPNLNIGINLPLFPELVAVPGYPVYYAPQLNTNYFFYDGFYWVYQDDNWYVSSWYNGPWEFVRPDVVPLFILRIPVRYYREPPVYFRGWRANEPPRWGKHWGHGWEQRRRGWDRWQRSSVPSRAPLPVYQRQYSDDRYPRVEQQPVLRSQHYRYEPRDRKVRQHFQQKGEPRSSAPVQRGGQEQPQMRAPRQHEPQMQHQRGEEYQRSAPDRTAPQQRGPVLQERNQPESSPRDQQVPRMREQERRSPDRGEQQEPRRGRGQGQDKDDDRGRGRNDQP